MPPDLPPDEYISDPVDYSVYITDWGDDWKKAASWLSTGFSLPIVVILAAYRESTVLFRKRAFELHPLFQDFQEHGIKIKTQPEYPHSLAALEEGEWPLTVDEQGAMKDLLEAQ